LLFVVWLHLDFLVLGFTMRLPPIPNYTKNELVI
jgi:hypothetical protein